MPNLFNKVTQREEFVPEEALDQARASGEFDIPADLTRTIRTPAGRVVEVPADTLEQAGSAVDSAGLAGATEDERSEAEQAAYIDEEYGGAAGKAIAGLGTALDSALLGLPGAGLRAVAPGVAEEFRRYQQASPATTTASGLVGAIAPAVVPGLGAANIAGKIGAGAARKLGSKGAGIVAEGIVQGAGQGLQSEVMSDKPIDIERLIGSIGTGALVGGAGAGVVSTVGKAAIKATARLGKEIGEAAAARASTGEEIVTKVRAVVDDADTAFLGVDGESRQALYVARKKLKGELQNTKTLASNPKRALEAAQKYSQAVGEALEEADDLIAKEYDGLAKTIAKQIGKAGDSGEVVLSKKAATKFTDWSGKKFGYGETPAVSLDDARGFVTALESGEVMGQRAAARSRLPAHKAMIDELEAAIVDHGKESFLGKTLTKAGQGLALSAATGLLPGGIIGTVGGMIVPDIVKKVGDTLVRRFSAATGEAAARSSSAVNAFLDAGAKVAPRAAAALVPLSSKTLAAVSYGPAVADTRPERVVKKESPMLASFRARERELRAQVLPDESGAMRATPATRKRIAENLRAVAAVSPMAADMMETVVARKLEFLASKLPKRPDFLATHAGPETWQPTDMEVRSFARYAAAVEDPGGVEERLVAGTVSPEDAEAYRTVYPERFERFKMDVVSRLPELRETLPYTRKVALSIYTGIPVDPAMNPAVLARLQAAYRFEEGTAGGQMAPRATANFGSVKAKDIEPGTPSQQRAG